MRFSSTMAHVFDVLQVELHGQYSLSRILAIVNYVKSTTERRAIAFILGTPLPCLAIVWGIEMLPLSPISSELWEQQLGYWFRISIVSFSVTFGLFEDIIESIPSLRIRRSQEALISTLVAAAELVFAVVLAELFGFPAPFSVQMLTVPWSIIMFFTLKLLWKRKLATDSIAAEDIRRFVPFMCLVVFITIMYAAFGTIYQQLHGPTQTAFTFMLPILKMILKSLFDRVLHRFEDVAPILIVLNLDVFHSLFVSLAMQQGPNGNSFGVLVLVDSVHSVIAFYEIRSMTIRARRKLGSRRQGPSIVDVRQDGGHIDLIDQTIGLLSSSESIRLNPLISCARHLRVQVRAQQFRRVVPASPDTAADRSHLEGVQTVLRLLHTTEFYLMIEYVEVIIAAIYSYLYLMSILSTRQYYTCLRDFTTQELQAKAALVAKFAAVELLTFLALCAVVDFYTRPRWAIRQVSFVLESHFVFVQAMTIFWFTFVTVSSLDHFGADYTFRFEWLRRHST